MSYLGNLTLRLAAGAMQLPDAFRQRHAKILTAAQRDDGGFAGREGPSDLYYTGFALRGLALLGELTEEAARRAADYLTGRFADTLPSVDFLSLVYATILLDVTHGIDILADKQLDRAEWIRAAMGPFQRDDGGYAKTKRSGYSSTYHTFLTATCLELIGEPVEPSEPMAQMILARQCNDGGFVELARMEHGGTNPTAAAIGLLRMLGAIDESISQKAAGFLRAMQNAEGGFRANTRIPVADLLSTFTGLVALSDLDALETIDLEAVGRYIASMEQSDGGYFGGAWDAVADVEYTFYGLGSAALLATVGK